MLGPLHGVDFHRDRQQRVIDCRVLVAGAVGPAQATESPGQFDGVAIDHQPFALLEQVAVQLFDGMRGLPLLRPWAPGGLDPVLRRLGALLPLLTGLFFGPGLLGGGFLSVAGLGWCHWSRRRNQLRLGLCGDLGLFGQQLGDGGFGLRNRRQVDEVDGQPGLVSGSDPYRGMIRQAGAGQPEHAVVFDPADGRIALRVVGGQEVDEVEDLGARRGGKTVGRLRHRPPITSPAAPPRWSLGSS